MQVSLCASTTLDHYCIVTVPAVKLCVQNWACSLILPMLSSTVQGQWVIHGGAVVYGNDEGQEVYNQVQVFDFKTLTWSSPVLGVLTYCIGSVTWLLAITTQ